MRVITPLRYPGGKAKIANFIKLILKANNLLDGKYVEPYAGGAGVALSLLVDEYVSKIYINDFDRSVYAFWHSVLNKTDELCGLINDTTVSVADWFRQQKIQKDKDADLLELEFSTFFLNRTNRSGIISGGIIGGKEQTGEWRIDARYNKENLIQRVQEIARYANRIHLTNLDAAELIGNLIPTLPAKTLTYFDPPYYVKGEGLYVNFYKHQDHLAISELIKKLLGYWVVSYDNVEQIQEMYQGYPSLVYDLSYSAAERYKGSEVMFFSKGLQVPQNIEPTKVQDRTIAAYQTQSLDFAQF